MSRRSWLLGHLVTLIPNGKYESTRVAARGAHLVPLGSEAALMRANAAFVWSFYGRFLRLLFPGCRKGLYDRVRVIGDERLSAATAPHRGVILLSVHLGDFDAAGGWLAARRQIEPVVVTSPLDEGWRDNLFSFVRRRAGVIVRDVHVTDCEVLSRDLAKGRAVLCMLDRRPPGPSVMSQFLGRPALAPAGIANLAASFWRDTAAGCDLESGWRVAGRLVRRAALSFRLRSGNHPPR